jgi:hypothetical protein
MLQKDKEFLLKIPKLIFDEKLLFHPTNEFQPFYHRSFPKSHEGNSIFLINFTFLNKSTLQGIIQKFIISHQQTTMKFSLVTFLVTRNYLQKLRADDAVE